MAKKTAPVTEVCPDCEGSGVKGVVTPEMAADAEDPSLLGAPLTCPTCEGACVIDLLPPDALDDLDSSDLVDLDLDTFEDNYQLI